MNASQMAVFSWNVNGIRSAQKKGLLQFIGQSDADVILLQETRAFPKDLDDALVAPAGYRSEFFPAERPGYSGVAIYTRLPHAAITMRQGLGFREFDGEGRWLEACLAEREIVFISAYFPNSQRDGARLRYKLDFCNAALERMRALEKSGFRVVLGGDINIAHEERDLANPAQNTRNAGFLPEERAWFSELVASGYVDTFRSFEQGNGHYSWWSSRPGVRERNIGWRLDYQIVSASLSPNVKGSRIHPDVRGSDHCPVSLSLDLKTGLRDI
jgi:exodeoxyribonuclease-3